MRFAAVALLASCVALPAPSLIGFLTQPNQAAAQTIQVAEAAKNGNKQGKSIPKSTAKKSGPKETGSANLPLKERIGIQLDLAFTGHYNGLINGELNDRTPTAIKAFQKSIGARETGALAQPERTQLAANSRAVQERVGWALVEDKVTGAQLGLPTKQAPNMARAGRGKRWSSGQGQVKIGTV